jgi:hypothetical protein
MRVSLVARYHERTVAPLWGAGAVFSVALFLLSGLAVARDSREPSRAEHGGAVAETRSYRFEVVFRDDGLWVYPRGKDGKAIAASGLAGTVTFYHPSSPQPWFARPLRPTGPAAGAPLGVAIRLSSVPATGAKATFQVKGLPDPQDPSVTFDVPVAVSRPAPRGDARTLSFSRATSADQAAIRAQRLCAVSGGSLGSMGTPIKVTRGGRGVFLCCHSCIKRVQANPDQYLGPTTR